MAFRATISFQFGIQSHHFFLVMAFRVTIFSTVMASRVTIFSQLQCSKPSSHHDRAFIATFSVFRATFLAFRAVSSIWAFGASFLVFDVINFLVWHSEPSLFNMTFKAIMFFFSLAFRDSSSVWCLEPYLQFGIQSRCLFLVWHSEPSHLQFGVQSRIFSLVFRVVVCF